jgi:hypothetical protein
VGDREKDRTELRKEIKIAIFWRKLIGDLEYVKFNPDDVLRWHIALEMRGPDEIRDLVGERYRTQARRAPMLGLVGEAPHPPVWMVREWLATKQPVFPKWRGMGLLLCFIVLSGLLLPTIHGCETLTPINPLIVKPPLHPPAVVGGSNYTVIVPPAFAPTPVPSFSTLPQSVSPMLNSGASPRVSSSQMGVAPPAAAPSSNTMQTGPTPTTTPTNSGISGSAPP